MRANTADGAGEWSPVAAAALQDPANRITGLAATPGNGQLTLNWTAPAWPATGYRVHYKLASVVVGPFRYANNPARGWVNANHSGTATSLVIPNLTNDVAYQVRVRLDAPHYYNHPAAFATATPTSGSSGTGRQPEPITRLGIAPDGSDPTTPKDGSLPPPTDQTPPQRNDYAELIAKIHQWRNDPCCAWHQPHTDRWDRVLLTLGETITDQTLEPMTAAEAQTYADRGWTRWTDITQALRELETPTQP